MNEDGGTMSLMGCRVAGNRAKAGGGLDTADVMLGPNTTTVSNTTIAKNRRGDCNGSLTSLGGNAGSCSF